MLIHNVNSTNHAGGVSRCPRRRGALAVATRCGVAPKQVGCRAAAAHYWLPAGGLPQVDRWYSKCCVLETYSFQPSLLLSLPASVFLFLSFSPSHIYFDNLMPI